MILGFLIWKYCCKKKKETQKVAPQSFTFVEEIETFEKKEEEKNIQLNSLQEDSGRSSICEMIQNFSDRLDRCEFSDKKNSFSSEFLIHHDGSNRYCTDIEEEEETLSSDDGNFIYAKEETYREDSEETRREDREENSQRTQTVDTSLKGKSENLHNTNQEMINVEIHLADDFYKENNSSGEDLLKGEIPMTFESKTFGKEKKSSQQNFSSSFNASSEYEDSNLSSDYYKSPSDYQREKGESEREFRNARQYQHQQEYYQSSDYQPQYVNFTFPRVSLRKKSSFHKNVPKVVRFNEEL